MPAGFHGDVRGAQSRKDSPRQLWQELRILRLRFQRPALGDHAGHTAPLDRMAVTFPAIASHAVGLGRGLVADSGLEPGVAL